MKLALVLAALAASAGCKDAKGKADETAKVATPTGSATSVGSAATTNPGELPVATSKDPVAKITDTDKGDQQDARWVPAEFKSGMARWKDTGVYLDGKPIGFMTFGELPITLQPTWVKDKVSADKPADCPIEKCPGWKWSKQRFYKFTDYLKALHVDVRKIKALHVYGPKMTQSIVVLPKDFASPLAQQFMFRFGADIAGKAIPQLPEGFANGKTPDKIASVMIYIDKVPPTLDRDAGGFVLDGQLVSGVPYYGDPLRGGVRVYLDDRLATIIKRQELDPKQATQTPDGDLHWRFDQFLASKNVDASKIVEGWVIRGDRREEKIPWSELSKMTFSASSQASGGVLIGDQKLKANVIALHTRAVKPDELPKIDPEELP
jgi:hypothetical protein